ncbi:hypothetical protein K4F52_005137 [Lecanicillium sp. MT-2017a]|nr:hypothetical protein K4F52_005137 [Lecanicillium sp. MT-2017a]
MENPLDQTSATTISLLEARLLRIEHLLCGASTPATAPAHHESARQRMAELEKRFAALTSHVRVYDELLKIYNAHPDFFHTPSPTEPPSQLTPDALRAIVLSSAPSFSATSSALTAIKDAPVPDPAESANLIALTERMKGIEATQLAQAAEMAELRGESEVALRSWYENGVLSRSNFVADMESRVSQVERQVRRREHEKERENEV